MIDISVEVNPFVNRPFGLLPHHATGPVVDHHGLKSLFNVIAPDALHVGACNQRRHGISGHDACVAACAGTAG